MNFHFRFARIFRMKSVTVSRKKSPNRFPKKWRMRCVKIMATEPMVTTTAITGVMMSWTRNSLTQNDIVMIVMGL